MSLLIGVLQLDLFLGVLRLVYLVKFLESSFSLCELPYLLPVDPFP